MKKYGEDKKIAVYRMRNKGSTISEISLKQGIPQLTVQRWLKERSNNLEKKGSRKK
jgi:hypothetical protein